MKGANVVRLLRQLANEIEAGVVDVDRAEVVDEGVFVYFAAAPPADAPPKAPPSDGCPGCGGEGDEVEGMTERYCADCETTF